MRPGGPVVVPIRSSECSSTSRPRSPASSASTAAAAARPFSTAGCTRVVSTCAVAPSSRTPSKPSTLTSRGTSRPSCSAARITPTASRSLCATIAVGPLGRRHVEQLARDPGTLVDGAAGRGVRGRLGEHLAHAGQPLERGVRRGGGEPLGGHLAAGARRVEGERDDGDAAVPERAQVLGAAAAGVAVVEVDRRRRPSIGHGLDRDDRDPALAERGDRRRDVGAAAEQDRGVDRARRRGRSPGRTPAGSRAGRGARRRGPRRCRRAGRGSSGRGTSRRASPR